MATQRVALIKPDGAIYNYYGNYGEAWEDAEFGDIIRILADLTLTDKDETIVLKNGVNIWIETGVVIQMSSGYPTIVDNVEGYEEAVNCSIYGGGIIKNTNSAGGNCILILNENSSISVECDSIEGENGISVQVYASKKFHLTCNKVSNTNSQALSIGAFNTPGTVEDINLNISKVETGDLNNPDTGTTALTTRGNGFINIDEIVCRNDGHCLLHQEGNIIARIKKMTSTMNRNHIVATVSVGQSFSTGTQRLILCFDEISCIGAFAIEQKEGTGFLYGRRVYSSNNYGLSYGGNNTKGGFLRCDEIVSGSNIAINISDFNNEYLIDANYIEGNYTGSGFSVVILSQGTSSLSPRFKIKNAKIKNKNTSTSAKGIYFENIFPKVTLNNVKIIAGNADNNIIYLSNGTSINVNNYGLFGNRNIDSGKIKLKIGTTTNKLFIESPDLN